jgi:cyclic beta-1,2-glucan synthetase
VYRHGTARYDIVVENPHGVSRGIATAELDGVSLSEGSLRILLADDGKTHELHIVLG